MASSNMALSYQVNIVDSAKSHLSPNLFDNLSVKEVPIPSPGPGSVLVRMRAAALNFRDLLAIADSPLYPIRTSPGLIPCNDGAGEIVSTGPDSEWKDSIGEAVISLPGRGWVDGDVSALDIRNIIGAGTANGTLTQYVAVQDPWIVRAPKNLSFEEAAALPGAAGSAINMLGTVHVGKGITVVTQGTGGVSCAVIQYASALGARVIATSSSDEKLQIAKKLGASELINYKTTPNWSDEVLRLTDGKGVDLVCDVGGSGTLAQSMKSLRQGGTACLAGFLTVPEPVDVVMPLITGGKILRGMLSFSRAMLSRTVALAEEHDIHPCLGNVYEWKDAPIALEQLRQQNTVGKIVIRV